MTHTQYTDTAAARQITQLTGCDELADAVSIIGTADADADNSTDADVKTVYQDVYQEHADADKELLKPRVIGHKLLNVPNENRIMLVAVYESRETALERTRETWSHELADITARIARGETLDAAALKREKLLLQRLDAETEPETVSSTAAAERMPKDIEENLLASFFIEPENTDAPVYIQQHAARGTDFESVFIEALDARFEAERQHAARMRANLETAATAENMSTDVWMRTHFEELE